jgi:hypothetical protein
MVRTGGLQQSQEVNFLIDTAAINRKYRARQDNPHRTWTGTTTVPRDATQGQIKSIIYDACNRYLVAMEKRNWNLVSKLRVRANGTAYDMLSNLPLLDKIEYTITGIFKFMEAPRTIRTEIAAEMVQTERNMGTTLQQVKRAL